MFVSDSYLYSNREVPKEESAAWRPLRFRAKEPSEPGSVIGGSNLGVAPPRQRNEPRVAIGPIEKSPPTIDEFDKA